jgi:hypothetical protein
MNVTAYNGNWITYKLLKNHLSAIVAIPLIGAAFSLILFKMLPMLPFSDDLKNLQKASRMTCVHACAYISCMLISVRWSGDSCHQAGGLQLMLLGGESFTQDPAATGDIDGGDFDLSLRGRQTP